MRKRTETRKLQLTPTLESVAHDSRGRLLNAKQVAQVIFGGHVSPEWVRRNVPGKLDFGHSTKLWWELDVYEYAESRREDDAL